MGRYILRGAVLYFVAVSIFSLIITLADKRNAKRGFRRVSESSLILISILGGSFAMYITMLLISHKTRHVKFMIGIPLIIIMQGLLILSLFLNFSGK